MACEFQGNVNYSVPPVSGATSYRWTFAPVSGSINLLRGSFNVNPSVVTDAPNVTAQFLQANGVAQGTLTVDALGPCGANGSRSFTLYRTEPENTVTANPPSGCTQCFTAPASAAGYAWSLQGFVVPTNQPVAPGTLTFENSPTTQTVCIRLRTGTQAVSGFVQVNYTTVCGNAPRTATAGFYFPPCAGGRVAAAEPVNWSVSPNPAHELINVTHPSESYQAVLTDLLGKQVVSQTATGHACRLKVSHLPNGVYILQIRDKTGVGLSLKHRVVIAH